MELAAVVDDEAYVLVETNDVDSFIETFHFFTEVGVGHACVDVHAGARDKGFEYCLRWLLGESDAVEVESGVAHDGGNVITAGYFPVSRLLSHAVVVPLGAEPAAHHFWQHCFEQLSGFCQHSVALVLGAGYFVALG